MLGCPQPRNGRLPPEPPEAAWPADARGLRPGPAPGEREEPRMAVTIRAGDGQQPGSTGPVTYAFD